ncbi:YitT family protein [Xylocopilactobacillus apicola]|uniref:Membrane protein n=1 Tax=Xylocopilactobacillus apicola TaxID=2932184 RepID=A0AAU9CXC9_9LACO|nr:YitT family protein [Xylocopilactobacillus apicola]BDR58634.1 membrane protein [Xylocopilactobacillus apicola]
MNTNFSEIFHRYQRWNKLMAAITYAISVTIAINVFWSSSNLYGSGVTGLAQLIQTISIRYFHLNFLTTPVMLFVLNIPLMIIAWQKIGHHFTFYTLVSLGLSTIFMHYVSGEPLTTNPIINAVFGGLINGAGTGFALRIGISTGGLDIIGILVRRKTGRSIGNINMIFNFFILLASAILFGWPTAFYSAIGIFVSARVMDALYTQQQRMQVIIVTDQPKKVIENVKIGMHRGVTIIGEAKGAYSKNEKTILLTIISRYELYDFRQIMKETDPHSFVSITSVAKLYGNFYEKKVA